MTSGFSSSRQGFSGELLREPLNIEVTHPDDFLLGQLDLTPNGNPTMPDVKLDLTSDVALVDRPAFHDRSTSDRW